MSTKQYDCLVCGSCVVDLLCRPVALDKPLGGGVLHQTDPVVLTSGGITCNSGITLAKLGQRVGAFTYVGRDAWGPVLRQMFEASGVDTTYLLTHPDAPTSTTVVAIDPSGERTFLHCVGAPKCIDTDFFHTHMNVFVQSRMMLLGYYSLMPQLENDLPDLFAQMRQAGCQTALDAAGDGGTMEPLERILPQLDVYVPSFDEATHQTGETDPQRIIDTYRACGAPGVLGVKLGKRGVMLSGKAGDYLEVPVATPPGEVVDTTGAGDSFYAGLLAGLLEGLSLEDAGKLGAATGACAVTAVGGSAGARDRAFVREMVGV